MRVRFLQRCAAYYVGADPVLEAEEARRLIAAGICEPFDKPEPKAAKVEPEPEPADVPDPVFLVAKKSTAPRRRHK